MSSARRSKERERDSRPGVKGAPVPDTIFAPATAPGIAAVAVMRLSGPEAARAITAFTGERAAATLGEALPVLGSGYR